MKSFTSFSVSLLALEVAVTSCNRQKEDRQPPNIVFIMSDDHAQKAISAYGSDLLQTPNIDRLAKEGAIFRQSFVTNSISAPSRAVMLTGKYSHINGKIDNYVPFDWEQDNVAKILQQSGYQTAIIGKIHLDGIPRGFDYSMVLPGQGQYYNPDFIINGEKKRIQGYSTSLITKYTLNWLDSIRDKAKPFLLLYLHKAPHRNWQPETRYLEFLEDREFDFPGNFFDDYKGRGSAAKEQEMEILKLMEWGQDFKFEYDPFTNEPTSFSGSINRMNDEQRKAWRAAYNPRNEAFIKSDPDSMEIARFKYQRYIRDYLKCIKSVDDGVGEVLDYLKRNGLDKNTVVVYTSDQGFFLGEHGWVDKRFMYEESFRTPLLVRYPNEIKEGTEINDLVVNIDLAPTFLDYAGITAPDNMQGLSFRKIAAGEKVPWRDAVYYHYYEYPSDYCAVKRHYGIRTERYKLIHFYYDVDEWELYDLVKDPNEMRSVYGDTAYSEVQKMLHIRLEKLRAEYGDSDELNQFFLQQKLD